MPKNELKLTLMADSTTIGYRSSYLQTGARAYVRVQGTGPVIDGTHSINAGMTHDMCVFVSDFSAFSVTDDANVVDVTCQIAEDVAWSSGQSQVLTLTNLLSAL